MDDAKNEHFFPVEAIEEEMFRESRNRSSPEAMEFGGAERAGRSCGGMSERERDGRSDGPLPSQR